MKKSIVVSVVVLFSLLCVTTANAQKKFQQLKGFAISADKNYEDAKMTKAELQSAVFGIYSYDPKFEGRTILNGFSIKFPHHKAIQISGTKLNEEAILALAALNPGDEIVVYQAIVATNKMSTGGITPLMITLK